MRIDAFRAATDFKLHMDQWITRFRSSKTIQGYDKVLIPGDPERESEGERKKNGIPLLNVVVDDLLSLSEKLGVEFMVHSS